MCPKAAATMLNIIIMCSQIVWGVLISSHFPFYPTEAENKGAKAYQVQHAFKLFWGTYPKNAIHFYIERKFLKSFLCLWKGHFFDHFSKYGFVFGISYLASFINSVLIGWHGSRVAAKRQYYISLLIGATSATAFAFVIYADNTSVFLGLSYLIR